MANATMARAQQEVDDQKVLLDARKAALDAAEKVLRAAKATLDRHEEQCDQDLRAKTETMEAAQKSFREAAKNCPHNCPNTPPPPPELIPAHVGGVVSIVGTDDNGGSFWSAEGTVTNEQLRTIIADFSGKSGPGNLSGTYTTAGITWHDEQEGDNSWVQRNGRDIKPTQVPSGIDGDSIAGLYVDAHLHEPGTLKGVRMISDRKGNLVSSALTIVGTDDGVKFWVLTGAKKNEQSGVGLGLTVNFTQAGYKAPYDKWDAGFSNGEIRFLVLLVAK